MGDPCDDRDWQHRNERHCSLVEPSASGRAGEGRRIAHRTA
jgi:hypothetical protein